MTDDDRSIAGVARTISQVLANKKFAIDHYQRKYKWEPKHLREIAKRVWNPDDVLVSADGDV